MPVALVDLLAAHQLKEAILLALLRRQQTGRGRHVHVALLDAAIASLANQASNYLVAGVVPRRMGSEHPNIVPYGAIHHLGDGRELVLAVGTERQWQKLAAAIERPELADDPRFADNHRRVMNRRALHAELERTFCALDSGTVSNRLGAAGVPFGFVNDMAAVFEQPGAERVLLAGSADVGELRGVRTFVAQGLGQPRPPSPPPGYNAHGREILEELGYDGERRAALTAEGVWPGEVQTAD